ncbi:hypothetical protein CDAR_559731 [Caerostris darwini]|uniref:Uncharacterized protein n=1 Tax=Caerostris darwini TaxID=1538125 RepID=A0AAV4SBM8_9ARAC|nr:hypothetical protein CDAR_559731 [Caerostris darwini]
MKIALSLLLLISLGGKVLLLKKYAFCETEKDVLQVKGVDSNESAGMLTFFWKYRNTEPCDLTLTAPEDHMIVISIEDLVLSKYCTGILQISSNSSSVYLCQSYYPRYTMESNTFLFQDPNITIKLTQSQVGATAFFNIVFTAVTNASCNSSTTYQCTNGFCINKKFSCDTHNNCFDYSDEFRNGTWCEKIQKEMGLSRDHLIIISFIVIPLFVLIVFFLASFCWKKYRRQYLM